MRLYVLAGGFGTRLKSVLGDLPKPLAPIGERAFLDHLIESWEAQDVDELVLLLHHKAEKIISLIKTLREKGRLKNVKVEIVVEDRPLGTGGAIKHAIDAIDQKDHFLVTNADTWLGGGLKALEQSRSNAMAVVRVENVNRYGSVVIADDRVVEFTEKGSSEDAGWINAGLYKLHPECFEHFEGGLKLSLEEDIFPFLVKQKQLDAIKLETDFIDIGIPADYFAFCNSITTRNLIRD